MGLSFRKSFKIGKNTRINLSKTGGVGFSTGVKGARVSVNKRGVRTQAGANGVYYRKDYGFGNGKNNSTGYNSPNYINSTTIKPVKVQDIIEHKNELKAIKKKVDRTLVATSFCLIFGLLTTNIILLSITILLCIFLFTKNMQWSTNINNACNHININKYDKAKKYLQKASSIKNDIIIYELNEYMEDITSKNEVNTNESIIEDSNYSIDLNDEKLSKQVDRNLKGKEFEKSNDIESAIALYEINIKEGFEGTHPYDRLTIIYRRMKQYDDEIRVIYRAIEVFEDLYINGREVQKENYKNTIEKYKDRLDKVALLRLKSYSNEVD